ncbi:Sas10/Utp3 family protein-like protein [Massariosphaeria phaeospora]|uniref:Sas10/Utp3 family protein-like protein n=1 Tax=Massariosphaeria phaeospora TaxID=100035 RepID=A0A7C8M3V4_9PLEO|nr:Sas10/Utp3 family protein-like protein [Massariosphaeria phaeospora]
MGKKRKAGGGLYGGPKELKDDDAKLLVNSYEDVADSEDEFHINRDKILLEEEPAAKRLRKWKEENEFLQPEDEEVLDYSDEDEDEEGKQEDDGDEDVGGWGPSKKDYYNADAIETEQDALDEEAEARRIQRKQLQSMTEADFGFDEDEWLRQDDGKAADSGDVVTEVLPQLRITDDMADEERLKILRTRYPEFDHISKEYLRLQPLHDELASAATAAERLAKARAAKSGKVNGSLPATPMAVTKHRACAAYLATMAMYFAILGSTAKEDGPLSIALDPSELHDHPVMESLLKCQRLWARVESFPVADPMVETTSNGDELSVIEEASAGPEANANGAVSQKKGKKLKKTKAELVAEATQARANARRAEKLKKTEEELTTLASLTDKSALRKAIKSKKTTQPKLNLLNADDSDFGEETEMTAHDLAEKAKKKKSLRFYTSQIVQKVNKRDAAGKDYGGDMDVPHRERLKDRQARLQAEAEKRGQNKAKGAGVPLGEGGESSDDNDERGGAYEDNEGYYDMVAARGNAKKQAKLDKATAYALAAKEGGTVIEEATIGEDGRRQISYQIEKNKGLTPHRKKSVRNPRVKKKLAYEKKTKKLKSMRPVYDAGKAAGNYGGEMTGIKKGLVRSRKL